MNTEENLRSHNPGVESANGHQSVERPDRRAQLLSSAAAGIRTRLPRCFQSFGFSPATRKIASLVILSAFSFCPRELSAGLANAWHIPDNTSDLGFTMRNPESEIGTNTAVTVYTGLQKFNNAYGTANQTGGAVFYKRSSQGTWSSAELQFFLNGGPNPNNQYWRASFTPAGAVTNELIQYYLRLTFDGLNEVTNTYLYAPGGRSDVASLTTADQKVAEADPFTFRIRPARLSPATNSAPVTPAPGGERQSSSSSPMWGIVAALGVIIGLLAGLLLVFRRQTAVAPSAMLTAPSALPALSGSAPGTVPASADEWRQRALAAEVMAAQQAQLLGGKVGPELTEYAKQALVQGLYTQRNTLLETQRHAQTMLQELEDRLAELQLPLQERIQAYEKRIAELEKELNNRSGEVRELTHATLLLVRQRLEQERERSAVRFS